MRRQAAAWCVLLAFGVSGCRLDVDTTVALRADDLAAVTVSAGFDAPLVTQLDRLGFDPLAQLRRAESFSWQVSRIVDPDGLLRIGLTQDALPIGEVADVLASLSDGLNDTDVGLRFDVDVTADGDRIILAGTALFTPPSTQGVWLDGTPLGQTADQLALQAAAHVDVWFTVTVDGTVVDHNADVAGERQVRWRMPVNETVAVNVVVEPASDLPGPLTVALLVMTLAGGAVWLWWRRRAATNVTDTAALPDGHGHDGDGETSDDGKAH